MIGGLADPKIKIVSYGYRVNPDGKYAVYIIVCFSDKILRPGLDEVLPGAGRQADGEKQYESFHILFH